ncbi:MAG: ribonuclease HII [Candidatus Daviesbacteria bacterium]|nr:ribonuclease HII [Candidatus Daviesbacteria bacterium]
MILPTLDFETQLWSLGFSHIAGLDEVGRGSFAGPVVVGAVVFPQGIVLPEGIRDSKLVKPEKRKILAEQIKSCASDFSIAEVSVEVINKHGIGKATQIAFYNAVKSLKQNPEYLLIDAFFIDNIDRAKQKPIAGGDKLCMSVAAASIIAKVYRDELMEKLSLEYPEYNFAKHKGYGTKEHQLAIKKHGLSPIHRKSFNLDKFL